LLQQVAPAESILHLAVKQVAPLAQCLLLALIMQTVEEAVEEELILVLVLAVVVAQALQ
jgi:hypothetical protein